MQGTVVRGQEVTDVAEFFDDFGNPLSVQRVTFTVRDFHRNLIVKGEGAQNNLSPEQWSCSFTIPDHAPTTDNTYYTITWAALDKGGNTHTNTTRFCVEDNLEDYPHEEGHLAFYQQSFNASLFLPFRATGLSLRIARDNASLAGDVLFVRRGPEGFNQKRHGNGYIYSVPVLVDSQNVQYSNGLNEQGMVGTSVIGLGNQQQNPSQNTTTTTTNADGTTTTTSMTTTYSNPGFIVNPGQITGLSPSAWGLNSMFMYWNYESERGERDTIVNRLYIVNGKMVRMMDDLRRQADRIRNRWTIPQLRLTDVDLAHFCIKGMDMFNSVPPSANGVWSLGNLPEQLYDIVFTGALARFFEAQYLALAETDFQFSGQAVSLSNQTAQYFESAAESYRRQFSERAAAAKRGILKSGGGAVVAGTLGATSLYVGFGSYGGYGLGMGSGGSYPTLPFLL